MKTPFLRNSGAALTAAAALSVLAGLQDEVPPSAHGADEQLQLLRTVNLGLKNYTAATRDKAVETVYRINRDMVKEMSTLDLRTVLAEVFATVPAFALSAVADGFATDFFCRGAAGANANADSFADFATSAMLRIYRRCRDLDPAGQRRPVFAVIMFLKASEGEPPDLQAQLEAFIPDPIRDMAREVWIPAALGKPNREDATRLIVPEFDEQEVNIGVHDSGMAILPWAQFDNKGVPPRIFGESQPGKKEGEKLP